MVFRPQSHQFPPSRGRYGFVLQPGGVMTATGPSTGDAPSASEGGSWSLRERELLLQGLGEQQRRYTIEEVSRDKLVLRQVRG
ncbi:MAG: hypothetical protein J0H49_19465 [Acidobacteria bacterium]|nr:hypothetical protein [Acidobacteriota bacterium]